MRNPGESVDIQAPLMSLKGFFRDARMQGGMAALAPGDATSLLTDFFARYTYDACGVDQLLALADIAQRARDFEVAREALSRAAKLPDKVHLAYYKMGRLELSAGRPGEAAERFGWGTEVDPAFPYNWAGRARALAAQGLNEEAASCAERFSEFGVRPHTAEDMSALSDLADYLFEAGERRRAGPIYRLVRAFGSGNARAAVRQAEALIAAGDWPAAHALLRPLHEDGQLDLWGRRALAHCESQAGHHAQAVTLAEDVVSERPLDAGFMATYLDVLVRSREPDRWRDAFERLGPILTEEGSAELQARLHLADGQVGKAEAILRDFTLHPQTRLFYLGVEAGYAALGAGEVELAGRLADRLVAEAPDVASPLLLRTDIFLLCQLWDKAAETLNAMPDADAQLGPTLLKWFEYYCFVGDTANASLTQARLEQAGLPSRQAVLPILRFLAEQQKWDEVAERALAWLDADFRFGQIGYVLYRAAKRTGRQADFLQAIEAVQGWAERADLVRLHTALAWDGVRSLAEMEQVAACAGPASPAMRHRMAVQRSVLARAQAPAWQRALFLCTNANYLCATIVALAQRAAAQRAGAGGLFRRRR